MLISTEHMENILTKEIVWLRLAVKVYDRYNDVYIQLFRKKKNEKTGYKQVDSEILLKHKWN